VNAAARADASERRRVVEGVRIVIGEDGRWRVGVADIIRLNTLD